jgi:hypothetical protein
MRAAEVDLGEGAQGRLVCLCAGDRLVSSVTLQSMQGVCADKGYVSGRIGAGRVTGCVWPGVAAMWAQVILLFYGALLIADIM